MPKAIRAKMDRLVHAELCERGPQTANEVAFHLGEDSHAVCGAIQHLYHMGRVEPVVKNVRGGSVWKAI